MSPGGSAMLLFSIFISALTTDVSALSCDWSGGSGKLEGYIPGNPSTVFVTNGAGECRDQCMSQTGFICAAVNYRASDRMCELLAENNQTASVVEPFDGSWLYFIRPLCAGIWLPWTAVKGKYITGSSYSSSTTSNLQDCMTSCMRDSTGDDECRGINIHTSSDSDNCKLRSDNAEEGVKDNQNWQYFNRPIWYSESSKGSTDASIQDRGSIGSYLHIFTDKKVPVGGYLVAWQYYLQPNESCTSYAAIFRGVDEYSYMLISRTKLDPETPTEAGVRFQSIPYEVIKVQKNDLLAVHTEKKNDGCLGSAVSIAPRSGPKTTMSVEAYIGFKINETRTYDSSNLREATPALKAYVSAYLSLDGTPQAYHNTSLSSGQIWLKLPPPLTTEESVVVVGYKLICSTDVNISQLVPCHDNLVPVNSRDVLLHLLDVARTYHVSVQMARNFNGVELLDDKYSPVSSAFCTERGRTDQVLISDLPVSHMEPKSELNVTLLHKFQADDMCAKGIKLNYSGYESEYRTIGSDLQREFILQFKHGTTYELTIYLKLADGAELAFWSKQHTTAIVTTTTSSTFTTGTKSNGASDMTESIDATARETTQSYLKEYKTSRAAAIGVGVVAALAIVCLLAIAVFCIIKKRRSASDADDRATKMQMKETGKELRKDKTKELPNPELPNEYEVPAAGASNVYEKLDLQSEMKTTDYEVVGTSHPHVYEGLGLR